MRNIYEGCFAIVSGFVGVITLIVFLVSHVLNYLFYGEFCSDGFTYVTLMLSGVGLAYYLSAAIKDNRRYPEKNKQAQERTIIFYRFFLGLDLSCFLFPLLLNHNYISISTIVMFYLLIGLFLVIYYKYYLRNTF